MDGTDQNGVPTSLRLTVLESSPLLVMSLQGELDIATLAMCRQQMTDALSAFTPDAPIRMVLDLSECEYLDSTGLAFFAGLAQAAKQTNGVVVFASPTPRIQRLFGVLDMNKVLTIALESARTRIAAEESTDS
jgi:anti-sigma B factor antagonist